MFSVRAFAFFCAGVVACSKTTAPPSPAPDAAPAPSTPASTPAGSCDGLEKLACVTRAGCILDQPAAGAYVCRAARNECERAVKHGDVIGHDVRGVTDADEAAAVAKCKATSGCTVAGGKCSCTCHVFGDCDCSCGGGWLPRCVPQSEASKLDGFPGR